MASIRRARNHWRAVWAIDIAGKRQQKSRTFATHREAIEFARAAERLYEARGVAAPGERTVAEQIERFLAWCDVHRQAATTHGYRKKLAYLSGYIGAIPLPRLTAEHLDIAYTAMLTDGGAGGRALHPRSVLHAHRAMHRLLVMAVKQNLIPDNPAARATPPTVPHHRAKAPTLDEAARLLAAAQRDPWPPLLALTLMTGLRRGEVLGLRWRDLDHTAGWLDVEQVVEQAGRVFRLRAAPKTKSSVRRIAIDPATCDVLRAWRGRLAETVLRAGIRWQDDALVFPDLRSGSVVQPYEPDAVTGVVHRIARRAGLPADVAPLHGLRHRHASSLMQLPLRLVADRLGHSTVRITADLYQHGDAADARTVADAAGAALGALIPLPKARRPE
jgi:integrase